MTTVNKLNWDLLENYKTVDLEVPKDSVLNVRVIPDAVCDEVVRYVKTLKEQYFRMRTMLHSIPTDGTKECLYGFLGDVQQPREFNRFLKAIAPTIDGIKPTEHIINRYDPGMYLPGHIDSDIYRANMVVNLVEEGDGIEIEGVFYEDVKGHCKMFPTNSAPHSVPPVKKQRYIIIYLYE